VLWVVMAEASGASSAARQACVQTQMAVMPKNRQKKDIFFIFISVFLFF
jgi:hypothetical protein